jgi:hypothetical protein
VNGVLARPGREDGSDTRAPRLRAWCRLTGCRFESSPAHRRYLLSVLFGCPGRRAERLSRVSVAGNRKRRCAVRARMVILSSMSADAEPLAPPGDSHATRAPGLVWEWTAAALGAVYAVPAALVIFDDLSRGLALSVGVLPPAIVGLAPTRRARRAVVAGPGAERHPDVHRRRPGRRPGHRRCGDRAAGHRDRTAGGAIPHWSEKDTTRGSFSAALVRRA